MATTPEVGAPSLDSVLAKLRRLEQENNWLREQVGLATHYRYGASSERTDPEEAGLLFNEAEVTAEPETPEPTLEEVTYKRRKAKGKREADLEGLAVEVIRHELPQTEQFCTQCSHPLHEIGSQDRQEIKVVAPQFSVVRHEQVKYGCRHCEKVDVSSGVTLAKMPPPAFPNSLASPSAVAFIISQKFELGLPLYRQEKYFGGLGFNLSRATMANWMIRGADLLVPLYHHLQSVLCRQDVLHADETTLQVLREEGRSASTQSYMWVYCSGRDAPPIALYDYQTTRSGSHACNFLKGFNGYLQVDGFGGYDKMPGVTLSGCWAHARRKFDEALKSLPPGKNSGAAPARKGLEFCNRLFAIEREVRDSSPQERMKARGERSKVVLDEFRSWLEANAGAAAPKSLLGVAIRYSLNQWDKLTVFLQDGRLEIDNNRCERAVKPFVIGRKNWMFSNTPRGARSSAVLYSVVETAKANGLVPLSYLTTLFERLPQIDTGDAAQLDLLMPWSQEMQSLRDKPPK